MGLPIQVMNLTLKQKIAISPLNNEVAVYEEAIKSNPQFTDYYREKITALEERISECLKAS